MLEPVIEGLENIEGGWWLLGAAALVGVAARFRPLVKSGLKGYMATRDGAARLSAGVQQGLTDLYQEAVRDYHATAGAARRESTARRVAGETSARPEGRQRGRRASTPG